MFNLFKKNPVKKLEKEYEQLLLKARDIQRSGDIKGYAKIMAQAEEVATKIDALNSKK